MVKTSPLRILAAILMLAAGIGILSYAMNASDVANRDYICYWAAGQQLAHHENPYDGATILQMQNAHGYDGHQPFFMRNPPSAFFLALPLGYVSERTGSILWSIAIVGALMASIRMLWILHGKPEGRLHLVGYLFPPALACLLVGQIGIFVLLGVTLFLYLHSAKPALAGAALLLCALKPHLFLPFGVALLAWIIARQAWAILAGAAGALVASLALAAYFDPHGWTQYSAMLRSSAIPHEFIPTISLVFRLAINRDAAWLQIIPSLVAACWALWYFRKHQSKWDWLHHGSVILLVGVAFAPYAWVQDQAIVLPAILAGLYAAIHSGRSLVPFLCIACVALIEVLIPVSAHSALYLWTAPGWTIWYLSVTRTPQKLVEPVNLAQEFAA
jgi:hypothetical protein